MRPDPVSGFQRGAGSLDRKACRFDRPPRCGREPIFVTDDWEGYIRPIPEKQLYTGKNLAFPIGQDNGNICQCLARFHRRTTVVSKCEEMVAATLKLYHHYHDCPGNLECLLGKTRSIFS